MKFLSYTFKRVNSRIVPRGKSDSGSTQFWEKMRAPKTKDIAISRDCGLTIEVRRWVKAFIFPRTNDGVYFEWNIVGMRVFAKMTANNSSAVRVGTFLQRSFYYDSTFVT